MKIKLLLFSLFLLSGIFQVQGQQLALRLDLARKNQITISEPEPGVYNLQTTGTDAFVVTQKITDTYDPQQVYVITFDYDAPLGLDDFEIRFGEPFSATRKVSLGPLPATTGLKTYKAYMKFESSVWNDFYDVFRFDFGLKANQSLQVRNMVLRAPTPTEIIPLDLNLALRNQMNISRNPDASYNITTLGGDPWVRAVPLAAGSFDPQKVYVMSFEYLASNAAGAYGINEVQFFYGPPIAGANSVFLGQQPATSVWKTSTVNLKLKAANWNQAYTEFRFDFGTLANQVMKVRNITLREPISEELRGPKIETDIPIKLDMNAFFQMDATLNTDGSYTMQTLGNDPRINAVLLDKFYDHNETYYISFDYLAPEGLDNLTVYYGAASNTRKADGGSLPATASYKTFTVNLKQLETWNQRYDQFRFDFGTSPGQTITVKNIRLRNPTQEEIDKDPIIQNAISSKKLQTYLTTTFPAKILQVTVDMNQVTVAAALPGNTGNLFLCELRMWDPVYKPENIVFSMALGSEEKSKTTLDRFVTLGGNKYDRIYSRWVIAEKTGDTFTYKSNAHFADDVYGAAKNYLPEVKPTSIKGIGASAGPAVAQDLLNLGVKNIRIGIPYATLLSMTPTSVSYEFGGQTFYFNPAFVNQLDNTFKNCVQNDFTATVTLLIPSSHPDAEKQAVLTHPDADSKAYYSIANVTSEAGVTHYAAITAFLAERYSRPDNLYGRITNWIIHNEVDAGSIWTNAGRKPMDLYTELYDRSMRTVYYTIRQYNPAGKVFISLTHYWASFIDYPPKDMLALLNTFNRKEGDYEWGIAHHPYPQSGYDSWTDTQAGLNLNSTPLITPKNIELLDTWIRSKENLYKGVKVRSLMFTEQGVNAGGDYDEATFEKHAAGIAYMWKKFSRLPSLEAVHYHRRVDNNTLFEGKLYFGLWTRDPDSRLPEFQGYRKPGWFVWQSAGTQTEADQFAFALPVIGVNSWDQTFNPILGEVDLCKVNFSLANSGEKVNNLQVYFNGEMHQTEGAGAATFFNVASLATERTIRYVSQGQLIWPEIQVTVQQGTQLSQDLSPVRALAGKGISPTQVELTWQDILSFETGFVLERRADGEAEFSLLDSLAANATHYVDRPLTPGMYYSYRLRAYNETVQTLPSPEITVLAPNLTVLYKNGNKPGDTKALRPNFQLQNEGTTAADLKDVKIRYWFMVEDFAPLSAFIDYAQIGSKQVQTQIVLLDSAREGANAYLELTFSATAGSIAGLENTGPIEARISKEDYSLFNETNDYSFLSQSSYTQSSKITVYQGNELVWGDEPKPVAQQLALVVLHRNNSLPADNSIKPELVLQNQGNQQIDLSRITLRYWFTPETASPLQYAVDYAKLGATNLSGSFGFSSSSYFELGFKETAGKLYALSQSGSLNLRINKSDWSNFEETNDFSYQPRAKNYLENANITAYLDGVMVWGSEPMAAANTSSFTTTVFPNPAQRYTSVKWSSSVSSAEGFVLVDQNSGSNPVSVGKIDAETVQLQLPMVKAGLYLLRGSINGQTVTYRLMIE